MSDDTSKTILLVEDEAVIAIAQRTSLEKYGYNVISVNSGEKAVNKVKEISGIDLILMDIDLGEGINGPETAAIILSHRDIPIVFLSAHTEPEIVEKTERITSYGYVVKNTGITILDASIKMAFRLFEANLLIQKKAEEINRLKIEELIAVNEEFEAANEELISVNIEMQRSENALRESEEKYRTIFENAPLGIFRSTPEGRFIEVNPQLTKMLGYNSPEEVLEKIHSISEQIYVKSCDRQPIVDKQLSASGVTQHHNHYRRADGSEFFANLYLNVIRDSESRILYLEGIVEDITERNLNELYRELGLEILKILNEPEDLHDSIKNVISTLKARTGVDAAGIRLQNGDDFPYFFQEGFSDDFLLTENTLIDHDPDGEVFRDDNGKTRLACICGLVISGKINSDSSFFTKGGSFWTNDSLPIPDMPPENIPRFHSRNRCIQQGYASIALVPIRDKDKIVGLIQLNDRHKERFTPDTIMLLEGIASNIGAALMRKQADDLIKSLLAEKELILKEVHHRIKNNMSTINGFLSLQIETLNDPSAAVVLKDAVRRIQSMRLLYDKLYLPIGLNKISIMDYIPVLIKEILETFPLGNSVHVESKIDDIILNMKIMQSLGIIINELLTNIMKHAFTNRSDGLIRVSGALDGKTVFIEIEDNGAGIPETVTFDNSKGFGMHLVSLLTEQIGGSIRIERGYGTKFILEFEI